METNVMLPSLFLVCCRRYIGLFLKSRNPATSEKERLGWQRKLELFIRDCAHSGFIKTGRRASAPTATKTLGARIVASGSGSGSDPSTSATAVQDAADLFEHAQEQTESDHVLREHLAAYVLTCRFKYDEGTIGERI